MKPVIKNKWLLSTLIFTGGIYFALSSLKLANGDEQSDTLQALEGTFQTALKEKYNEISSLESSDAQNSANKSIDTGNQLVPDSSKKAYESDWCHAESELSLSDLHFAQSELEKYELERGKAIVGTRGAAQAYSNESYFKHYEMVAPYDELDQNALKTQVLDGNKWAMITWLQKYYSDLPENSAITKSATDQLLTLGATYIPIKKLIADNMQKAAALRNQSTDSDEYEKHIEKAIAALLLGLDDFEGAHLTTFSAFLEGPLFSQSPLPKNIVQELLPKAKNRYNNWKSEIENERESLGIEVLPPPRIIQLEAALSLAVWEDETPQLAMTLQPQTHLFPNEQKCYDFYKKLF